MRKKVRKVQKQRFYLFLIPSRRQEGIMMKNIVEKNMKV